MRGLRRRRLVRILGWIIAALASVMAAIALLGALYLALFDYPEMLRSSLESELRRLSGGFAEVGSINLDLPTFAFEIRDVNVGSTAENPWLHVGRVRGRLRLAAILSQELHWDELSIDELSVRLVEADGRLALPVGRRPLQLSSPSLSFVAETVSITNAAIVLDNEKVPWRLTAENVNLVLARRGLDRYEGSLAYENGRLAIKDHEPLSASVATDFEVVARELLMREAVVSSEFGEARLTGKISFAGAPRGRFDIVTQGDIGRAIQTIVGVRSGPSLASGDFELRGGISIEPENKTLQGTVTLARGFVAGQRISDWTGELFWDHSLLQLSYAEGTLAGGRARVQLHQPLPVATHEASVDVDLVGGSLGRFLEGLRGIPSPVDSQVSGTASLVFFRRAPERLAGSFELIGLDTPNGSGESLSFSTRGRISEGDVEIEQGRLETGALEATISGRYPREGSAELLVDASFFDLASAEGLGWRVRNVLFEGSEAGPVGVSGRGRARGRLLGRFPDLSFEGEIVAEELSVSGLLLDSIRGKARLSPEGLTLGDFIAHNGSGTAAGNASMLLGHPDELRGRDFEFDASLTDWPVPTLLSAIGVSTRIDGAMTGELSIKRAASGFSGGGSVVLDQPGLWGMRFDRARGRVSLSGAQLRAESVTLSRGDAEMRARVEVDLGRRSIAGRIETERFPLAGIELFGLPVEGYVGSEAELDGTLERPVVTLTGRARSLTLGSVPVGEVFITGELRDGNADVSLKAQRASSELSLDVQVALDGVDPTSTGTLRWQEVDLAPWLFGGSGLRLTSSGEGRFRALGTFERALSTAELDATLTEASIDGEDFRFVSSAPFEINLRDSKVEISRVDFTRGTARVSVSGSADLSEKRVDLEAEGAVGLGVLQSFYPTLRATGRATLVARLEGSWSQPSVTGYADLDGASVRISGFPQALGGLSGRLVFDNRTVRISEMRGVFGSGPVIIAGTALLEGRAIGSLDLRMEGTAVRIRYPEGLVATADAELRLLGSSEERVLAGQLTLRDAVWSREYDLVAGILSDRESQGTGVLFGDLVGEDLLQHVRFDVEVTADESLKLRNSVANIDASATLSLRGTVREPVLLGRTEAARGEVYFLGQRYDITSGRVDFVDPDTVEPFIDLTAETRVRSYRVELRLTGTPDRFQPELSSDPPLRTVEILRLLAGASDRDIDLQGNEEEALAGVGVASLLTERLNQEVGRRAERLFGLDRFSIDPFLVGQFANPTARVSVGKRITPELSINYSSNLNATTEAIILIEYTPEGPMSWILSRDEEGDVGIDVKFRKSF
ncbi:MAG TPA: translocation/assembly module TamB domain-containing protein [Vicinamibacteria bacterium]|nr:translocation/assembly module TamB domain-containing protein [Vicinamibacteria bacterium]